MAQVDSETSTAVPASDAGPLYIPTDVTPEELFQAIGRLRKEARDEIDRLIRFLDETDNHMELEEAADDVACDDSELDGEGEDDEDCGTASHPSAALPFWPEMTKADGRLAVLAT